MNNVDDDGLQQQEAAGGPVRRRGRGRAVVAGTATGGGRHVAPPRVRQPPQDADGPWHIRHTGMDQDGLGRTAFEPFDGSSDQRDRAGPQDQTQRYGIKYKEKHKGVVQVLKYSEKKIN